MDMFEQAAALLQSLGASLGVELQPDETGACGLRIDERLDMTLRYEPSPPALLVYSPVGSLPEGRVEGVLRRLLEANHLWDASRGATWSLSADEVILSRLLPLPELELEVLAAELASFAEVAFALQRALEARPAASAPAAPAFSGSMLRDGMFRA